MCSDNKWIIIQLPGAGGIEKRTKKSLNVLIMASRSGITNGFQNIPVIGQILTFSQRFAASEPLSVGSRQNISIAYILVAESS